MQAGSSSRAARAGSPAILVLILGPVLLLQLAAGASPTPQGSAAAACPSIVPRQRWGAAESAAVRYVPFPMPELVVGHTAGAACASLAGCARAVRGVQQHHMQGLGFGDIGYSFLIGGDGLIFEGRGWHQQGAHTRGYNARAIGVAFIGDYSDTGASAGQMGALRDLVRCGVALGELSEAVRLYGQLQVQSTESPGLALYQQLQDLPEWVERVPDLPDL